MNDELHEIIKELESIKGYLQVLTGIVGALLIILILVLRS